MRERQSADEQKVSPSVNPQPVRRAVARPTRAEASAPIAAQLGVRRRVVRILAVAVLAGLAWFQVQLVNDYMLVRDLRAHGVPTTGRITSVTPAPKSNDLWDVGVDYLGAHHRHDMTDYRPAVGDEIPMLVDPQHPSRAMATDSVSAWSWVRLLVPVGVAVLFFGPFLVVHYVNRRKAAKERTRPAALG